jgi:hypothetical protein
MLQNLSFLYVLFNVIFKFALIYCNLWYKTATEFRVVDISKKYFAGEHVLKVCLFEVASNYGHNVHSYKIGLFILISFFLFIFP